MASARTLEQCIFCGSDDMTEEHVVSDWVIRAYMRSRKRQPGFSGTFVGRNEVHMTTAEPFDTAEVVCGDCNHGWMSDIDRTASELLKPYIRGRGGTFTLDPEGQAAVAAWLFKSALIFEASQGRDDSGLSRLRPEFFRAKKAPPGCVIVAGPAPPTPFAVEGIPEIAGVALFGVRTFPGQLNLTLNEKKPDGTVVPGRPTAIPTPGWLVMVGNLQAIISGQRAPVIPTPEWRFSRIWPIVASSATVTTVPSDLDAGP